MIDLTKITTPFGLLDDETKKALQECEGPWVWLSDTGKWIEVDEPSWGFGTVYRPQTKPKKPIEIWVNVYGETIGSAHECKSKAVFSCHEGGRTTLFREVIE